MENWGFCTNQSKSPRPVTWVTCHVTAIFRHVVQDTPVSMATKPVTMATGTVTMATTG